jgi:cytochrome c553
MMRHILLVLLGLATVSECAFAQEDFERLRAYGEHLAQECVACHRTDGGPDPGIRSIIGWQGDLFVNTMKAYRNQEFAERRNPVMVSVARSLNDDEISALATYFGALKQQ